MTPPITLIGNVNIDLVMGNADPWPQPGTEVILPHSEWRVGGAAGNSALALQALGAPYRIIANRGNDDFGAWLAKPFGDKAGRWTIAAQATALTVGITHPDGERTFFTSLGHLAAFSLDDVLQQLPDRAEPGGIALLSGGFVLPKLRAQYGALLAALRMRGYGIALDTGWPDGGWTQPVRAEVRTWIAQCQHVLINEAEARGLTGLTSGAIETVSDVLHGTMPQGAALVIKRGGKGAFARIGGACFEAEAPRVRVVDTIGAGDVFNAAYLAGLAQNSAPPAALASAVTTASIAISTVPRSYGGAGVQALMARATV
jgi:sugar/nucleoside kinase (ribokinase family)